MLIDLPQQTQSLGGDGSALMYERLRGDDWCASQQWVVAVLPTAHALDITGRLVVVDIDAAGSGRSL